MPLDEDELDGLVGSVERQSKPRPAIIRLNGVKTVRADNRMPAVSTRTFCRSAAFMPLQRPKEFHCAFAGSPHVSRFYSSRPTSLSLASASRKSSGRGAVKLKRLAVFG